MISKLKKKNKCPLSFLLKKGKIVKNVLVPSQQRSFLLLVPLLFLLMLMLWDQVLTCSNILLGKSHGCPNWNGLGLPNTSDWLPFSIPIGTSPQHSHLIWGNCYLLIFYSLSQYYFPFLSFPTKLDLSPSGLYLGIKNEYL